MIFLVVKFRVFSRCKRCRDGTSGSVGFDGPKKKKYKDMTVIYDSSSSDVRHGNDTTKEKYKDWFIEDLDEVETESIINVFVRIIAIIRVPLFVQSFFAPPARRI